MDVDTGFAHTFEESAADLPAAHIVVDDSHLYPFACLVHKCICHEAAQGVVFKDVGVEMDVVSRRANGCKQGREEVVAAGVDSHFVVFKR